VGTPTRARRKNDDSPRLLRYLTFPESFHWLIAKTQTQDPIISPKVWETAISGKRGKNANSTVDGVEAMRTSADCGTFKNSDIFTFFLDIFTWSMNISAAS